MMHGGNTKQARQVGLQRWEEQRAEQRAAKELERRGHSAITDPVDELYNLAGEVVAWKNLATERRDELSDWSYRSDANTEQLRTEIAVWERAVERAAKILVDLEKLGLAEKRIRVSALQAAQVSERVLAALRELFAQMRNGLSIDDAETQMPALLRKHLLGE